MSNKQWYFNNDDNAYAFPEINKVARGKQKILLSDNDIDSSEFLTSLITKGSISLYVEDVQSYMAEEFNHTHETVKKPTPEDEYLHDPEQQALIIGGDDTIVESFGGSDEEVSLDPRVVNSRVEPDTIKKKI